MLISCLTLLCVPIRSFFGDKDELVYKLKSVLINFLKIFAKRILEKPISFV